MSLPTYLTYPSISTHPPTATERLRQANLHTQTPITSRMPSCLLHRAPSARCASRGRKWPGAPPRLAGLVLVLIQSSSGVAGQGGLFQARKRWVVWEVGTGWSGQAPSGFLTCCWLLLSSLPSAQCPPHTEKPCQSDREHAANVTNE